MPYPTNKLEVQKYLSEIEKSAKEYAPENLESQLQFLLGTITTLLCEIANNSPPTETTTQIIHHSGNHSS